MSIINEIKEKIIREQYEYSKHAVDQTILRHIQESEIKEVLLSDCEIIENYPEDKYGPSCLIFGFAKNKKPLHVQISYPDRIILKIITVYEPNGNEWINYKIRRKRL